MYDNIDAFGWAFAAKIARRNGDEVGRKFCERKADEQARKEAAEQREWHRRLTHGA